MPNVMVLELFDFPGGPRAGAFTRPRGAARTSSSATRRSCSTSRRQDLGAPPSLVREPARSGPMQALSSSMRPSAPGHVHAAGPLQAAVRAAPVSIDSDGDHGMDRGPKGFIIKDGSRRGAARARRAITGRKAGRVPVHAQPQLGAFSLAGRRSGGWAPSPRRWHYFTPPPSGSTAGLKTDSAPGCRRIRHEGGTRGSALTHTGFSSAYHSLWEGTTSCSWWTSSGERELRPTRPHADEPGRGLHRHQVGFGGMDLRGRTRIDRLAPPRRAPQDSLPSHDDHTCSRPRRSAGRDTTASTRPWPRALIVFETHPQSAGMVVPRPTSSTTRLPTHLRPTTSRPTSSSRSAATSRSATRTATGSQRPDLAPQPPFGYNGSHGSPGRLVTAPVVPGGAQL